VLEITFLVLEQALHIQEVAITQTHLSLLMATLFKKCCIKSH